jgi:hypothetical protein
VRTLGFVGAGVAFLCWLSAVGIGIGGVKTAGHGGAPTRVPCHGQSALAYQNRHLATATGLGKQAVVVNLHVDVAVVEVRWAGVPSEPTYLVGAASDSWPGLICPG